MTEYKNKKSERASIWLHGHREHFNTLRKRRRDDLRRQCIEHYGGCCACCGEDGYVFLALDHINGGGKADREAKGGVADWWYALVKQGFPDGYQVLCHNCNWAKHSLGVCPHQVGMIDIPACQFWDYPQ